MHWPLLTLAKWSASTSRASSARAVSRWRQWPLPIFAASAQIGSAVAVGISLRGASSVRTAAPSCSSMCMEGLLLHGRPRESRVTFVAARPKSEWSAKRRARSGYCEHAVQCEPRSSLCCLLRAHTTSTWARRHGLCPARCSSRSSTRPRDPCRCVGPMAVLAPRSSAPSSRLRSHARDAWGFSSGRVTSLWRARPAGSIR